jgi:hypothetical protein
MDIKNKESIYAISDIGNPDMLKSYLISNKKSPEEDMPEI